MRSKWLVCLVAVVFVVGSVNVSFTRSETITGKDSSLRHSETNIRFPDGRIVSVKEGDTYTVHEDCIAKITKDLTQLLNPRYLEVVGEFTPRGGIAIYPFVNTSNTQKEFISIKEQRLLNYSPGKYSVDLNRIY